ncbi:hypothetical protein A0H81_04118 [Grifola frondosa]|uniref:Uncharacterized protein n=1 Tax=Grifola frondosa TaxID=5627 RepID=A0A1C7MG77_GRIFR|nr:hypothetical protein A0H81_04118 [Grifola frondosa]
MHIWRAPGCGWRITISTLEAPLSSVCLVGGDTIRISWACVDDWNCILVNAQNHYMGLIQTETPYYQPSPAAPAPFSLNTTYNDPSLSGQTSAWALSVQNSSNIIVFGAGLYSFFQNYAQTCLNSSSCQSQVLNVDSGSSISIYSLATLGVMYQLSVNGQGIIPQSANRNGFQSTVTAWTH